MNLGERQRLVRREWPTDIGPVDLMCRDSDDGWVAVEIKPLEFVGPQVGTELRNSAITALAITLGLVFLYLVFRFHTWRRRCAAPGSAAAATRRWP